MVMAPPNSLLICVSYSQSSLGVSGLMILMRRQSTGIRRACLHRPQQSASATGAWGSGVRLGGLVDALPVVRETLEVDVVCSAALEDTA